MVDGEKACNFHGARAYIFPSRTVLFLVYIIIIQLSNLTSLELIESGDDYI